MSRINCKDSPWAVTFVTMLSITLFVSCFLIGYSVDSVHPNEMSFIYNQNQGDLRTHKLKGAERYDSGREFTGLGRRYKYKFPRTQRMLRFTNSGKSDSGLVKALTAEGLQVTVGFSFQYHLFRDAESVANVFYNFGDPETFAWEEYYIMFARQTARDVLSLRSVRDLWEDRADVSRELEAAIRRSLADRWANVTNVQLLSLEIPEALQSAIEATTVEEQRIAEAVESKAATRVSKLTEEEQSKQDAFVTLVNADATAITQLISARADAAAARLSIVADAAALQSMKTDMNMTQSELLDLHLLDALRTTKAGIVTSVTLPSVALS